MWRALPSQSPTLSLLSPPSRHCIILRCAYLYSKRIAGVALCVASCARLLRAARRGVLQLGCPAQTHKLKRRQTLAPRLLVRSGDSECVGSAISALAVLLGPTQGLQGWRQESLSASPARHRRQPVALSERGEGQVKRKKEKGKRKRKRKEKEREQQEGAAVVPGALAMCQLHQVIFFKLSCGHLLGRLVRPLGISLDRRRLGLQCKRVLTEMEE